MRDSTFIAGWMKEGTLEARRKDLLRALQLRLQNPVPVELIEAVNSCADLDELERWFDLSQTANTLAEFRADAGV